ncbi:helix-turn-helix domain-containing protein [Streptomyces sp. OE57]|uniref:helix-turn-helix domain-containing protein n=1 Tax=Streptomyces lacaronensis TaxID=3379885 RepID=UPI0039B79248
MLLRLAYLGVTNAFALLRLLPMGDRGKDVEILALRHQVTVLERQLGGDRVRFTPSDRAFLAALLHRLPLPVLRRVRLLVRPDTVLCWHRDFVRGRHAALSRSKRPGRPRTARSIRILVLRLAGENPQWGYRRLHGELLVLGVKVAASTVWRILKDAGVDPAPDRGSSTWADFLRFQADALLVCDFFDAVTSSGARMYVLVVIEHSSRRIRVLGGTAHPTASWVTQAGVLIRFGHDRPDSVPSGSPFYGPHVKARRVQESWAPGDGNPYASPRIIGPRVRVDGRRSDITRGIRVDGARPEGCPWLSGCRRLHRRYERKPEHFLAFTAIAATLICHRRLAK